MCKAHCEKTIERLVNYMMSIWMYDYNCADREECRKEIKQIMEEMENGKETKTKGDV